MNAEDTRRWIVFVDGPAAEVWVVTVDDRDEWTYQRAGGAHGTPWGEYTSATGGRAAAEENAARIRDALDRKIARYNRYN